MLGVVVMASALRTSVDRGIREAAELDIHIWKQIGSESCMGLESIQIVSTKVFLNA